jgi:hypothetical protein
LFLVGSDFLATAPIGLNDSVSLCELILSIPIFLDEILVLGKALLDGDKMLLAFISDHLVLLHEHLNQLINRLQIVHLDNG